METITIESNDSFGARSPFQVKDQNYEIFRLRTLEEQGLLELSRMPFCMRVWLENALRCEDGYYVGHEDIEKLLHWRESAGEEIAFFPVRVVLQDFTGVPCMVDFAAMRDVARSQGIEPSRINPVIPVDLVIDHSVQVDRYGTSDAFSFNRKKEHDRNRERYTFLKWAQKNLRNFRLVPPGVGIVHQVNLEYLTQIVGQKLQNGRRLLYPDSLIGTDSHTPMINGIGVFGFGVGGIEAEAVMLGQPYYMPLPEVVGVRVSGAMNEGTTATDLVLTVTELLRREGVVEKIVEFFGPGLDRLTIPDRATISNMAPEYGATMGFFPIDGQTLDYLRFTGRDDLTEIVERYAREQGLFREAKEPEFAKVLHLELAAIRPSMAGPKRPQDRVFLADVKDSFARALKDLAHDRPAKRVPVATATSSFELSHGSVVIAAITSCTNTSNPSVMVAAGLVAKKALAKGLKVKPWVKTSLAPGSRVVVDYLEDAGLLTYLEEAGFYLVGYGCTTCIGNSGPLLEPIADAIAEHGLIVASVLSGNRNFEGRIHPLCKANYLASPPLVVAYAFAGRIDVDLENSPIGEDSRGEPVYLKDLWPTAGEISQSLSCVSAKMFRQRYARVFQGETEWEGLPADGMELFPWDDASTYIRRPPFLENFRPQTEEIQEIRGARVLALLGDSVTTDHISPAGTIPTDTPAGKYLVERGVKPADFNSYGSRRGNHEVMMRGTFAQIRIKNLLVPGTEGGYTVKFPGKEQMTIYDAAMQYKGEGAAAIVIAGKEYGSGSSRDWAAKGTRLLGVRAVIAESYERIHHSNLVGMGVLPLQFKEGENYRLFHLTGEETFDIHIPALVKKARATVIARRPGFEVDFETLVRLDTQVQVDYYRQGGILHAVLRRLFR